MAAESERPDEQPDEASLSDAAAPPEPMSDASGVSQSDTPPAPDEYQPRFTQGALFPHEVPSKHWQADFSDSRQVYQGSALPIWILAGWAAFIIWALVYLYFGLSKF
jgi:hypothetical protein